MDGFNNDLQFQMEQLEKIILSNEIIKDTLEEASDMELKNYYIGAGCIAQTVWNYQMKLELSNGISDIDFAYYDDHDLSIEAENSIIENISKSIMQCPIKLDIKNQARVHLWYKDHFGYDIKPINSVEDAINRWPTTATSIGVRLENGKLKIYAPFGLNDLFGMIVRANKAQITEEIYLQKANKWITKWPALNVIPW
jgi:hypothetical protein